MDAIVASNLEEDRTSRQSHAREDEVDKVLLLWAALNLVQL